MKAKGAPSKKAKTSQQAQPHPWTDLASQTSFDFAALDVLAEHHRVLSGFCSDPSMGSIDNDTTEKPPSSSSAESTRLANLQLSFAQYCISLSTLTLYGSPTQQFEYLFHAYAIESEHGITRAEIFQLLQDHFYKRPEPQHHHIHVEPKSKQDPETDVRHFERLYTWFKKHMAVYDRARCGFLPLSTALEMLHAHPSALQHLQLQIDALIKKMHEYNTKYCEKAAAAQIDEQLVVGSTVVGDE